MAENKAWILCWSPVSQIVILLLIIYCIYRRGCPKPIPGIPYNAEALNNFMGDVTIRPRPDGQAPRDWLGGLGNRHNYPLVQIFVGPFARPSLILFDYWEAYDICHRRTKEFDKSSRNTDIFALIVPNNHGAMKSADPRFRSNKELVKDLMSPTFMNQVSAPELHKKALSLIQLWRLKMDKANGRSFEAGRNISDYASDAILSASFGQSHETTLVSTQIEHVKRTAVDIPDSMDEPTWFMQGFTKLGKYYKTKDGFLRKKVQQSVSKMSSSSEEGIRSALDHLIMREVKAAAKTGREPQVTSLQITDEMMGYIVAGYETSSATISWAVKYLTDFPNLADTLRRHLHVVYQEAREENRYPTASEIVRIRAPYLDAFMEETFRYILGHWVPKGTTIWFYNHGPGFLKPEIKAHDVRPSRSSQADKQRVHPWPEDDIDNFKPERWLRPKAGVDKAKLATDVQDHNYSDFDFDKKAGPIMTFGAGPRGCFGQRLAHLELRIFLVLILWEFELLPCPESLNTFTPVHGTSTHPRDCYVRLKLLV
ncbi:hypothetical protein DL766_009946 [Monosporascus sp. MC13-8B]|uniref:Cytochrome P450 n=1 Tax=Monosporascus cannonballus TaxID=155416 RepID=A0ABY0H3H5_9PEZI|nr:hypothetical protein DL762_005929 [Monosporascus cannonballus]RYO91140.1 hypothetical protein DL763_005088 [Monosporascus cannonballus]RYP12541.1 hypothetical protein DL766_009946 [Monosporascus sp. MC13-8B]